MKTIPITRNTAAKSSRPNGAEARRSGGEQGGVMTTEGARGLGQEHGRRRLCKAVAVEEYTNDGYKFRRPSGLSNTPAHGDGGI